MSVTTSCRLTDNIMFVGNSLWTLTTPMQTIAHAAPFADEGYDDLIRRMAEVRGNLTDMLAQIDVAMMSVEATKAAALTPAERSARVELVAEAKQARVVSSGPPDSDFRSSAAA
ncbi:hypothetical protein [Methylobacterium bullatum]|uniref:Uncharacterized protein n=1 Tax=Methylobacterium bullatum TaxID=570505 RepID=A0AAV4ZBV2_9HYPH|nr:hypothetical protein [Methylobacterium bullatum]MBD8902739.1 hypothetical protein [Methylobacterium bullatum]GJD41355.1 hypothetical protein OICFNHDK_3838 [Methylobacterium bullatum]